MIELGKKSQIVGADQWPTVRVFVLGKPRKMPSIPEGRTLVCGIDYGEGQRIFVCDSLDEMQTLYYDYAAGHAVNISWYHAPAIDKTDRPTEK
jgi:hypothetical protein